MASAERVVQSDVFHIGFNRITTTAMEPFSRSKQKMALLTAQMSSGTFQVSPAGRSTIFPMAYRSGLAIIASDRIPTVSAGTMPTARTWTLCTRVMNMVGALQRRFKKMRR